MLYIAHEKTETENVYFYNFCAHIAHTQPQILFTDDKMNSNVADVFGWLQTYLNVSGSKQNTDNSYLVVLHLCVQCICIACAVGIYLAAITYIMANTEESYKWRGENTAKTCVFKG